MKWNTAQTIVFIAAGCVLGLMVMMPPWISLEDVVEYAPIFQFPRPSIGRFVEVHWERLIIQVAVVLEVTVILLFVLEDRKSKAVGRTARRDENS